MTSKADFVFFYDINQGGVSLIDLPLLQENKLQLYRGCLKDFKVVKKVI